MQQRPNAVNPQSALAPYGWSDQIEQQFQPYSALGLAPGRVIRVDRGLWTIATQHGTTRCRWSPLGEIPQPVEGAPVTGDWVGIGREDGDQLVVAVILPRTTVIRRTDPDPSEAKRQVLVANMDKVFIVHGLDRPQQLERIERSLVLVWESGAEPVIVLTKRDLVSVETAQETRDAIANVAPGVAVEVMSNTTAVGLDQVQRHIEGTQTVALIGESGTGKSTLINNLVGDEVQAIDETRAVDGKGRHTTVTRDLIPMPSGGVLIDTPGLRTLGIWVGEEGLPKVFADVEALAAECQFRDCGHESEPGCAVQAAIQSGSLDRRRLDNYRRIESELTQQAEQQRRRGESAASPSRPKGKQRRTGWDEDSH